MKNYSFGAGGFKLGERVEIRTTGQRGVLISEVVHISGCNTYRVLLPGVIEDGGMKMTNVDYLILRRLDAGESFLDKAKELTEENSFLPKGDDVNSEWIRAAVEAKKEFVPEIDEAVGVEKISIRPGMEVWNKVCGLPMLVQYIYRDIFSKELEYGLTYMEDDREVSVNCRAYCLIPLELKIDVYPASKGKTGPVFEDGHDSIRTGSGFSVDAFRR